MKEKKIPSPEHYDKVDKIKKVKKLKPEQSQELESLLVEADALTPAKKIKDTGELVYLQNGSSINIDDYVQENYVAYYPHFQKQFFYGIARLFGYDPSIMDEYRKPECVPQFINRFIYGRFPNGVLARIQSRNPFTNFFVRKYKNFQFLTISADSDLGVYIQDAINCMEECENYKEFVWKYSKQHNLPIQLSAFEDPEPKA